MNLEKDKEPKDRDNQSLQELKELLELYKNLPEVRKKNISLRMKRESAGEILTDEAVEKERKKFTELFNDIEDKRKKKMIERKIKEIAFQVVAMREAKESIMTKGLQTEVINGQQKYMKENPAVGVYDKYSRAYNANIDKLIEYLPPQETKKISKLQALRES